MRNEARLRITVASDEAKAAVGVRLGNVIACSDTACHKTETPPYLNIENTKGGNSTFVVDMAVPRRDITKVYFEGVAGPESIDGDIDLLEPASLAAPFQGAEIFVVLKKYAAGGRSVFKPVSAGWVVFGHIQASVYYNPSYETKVKLRLGTEIRIPPGAMNHAQVFRVQIHDSGKFFPDVDFFPYVNLLKPAEIDVQEIIQKWKVPGYQGPEPMYKPVPQSKKIRSFTETGKPATYRNFIGKTGFIVTDPQDGEAPVKNQSKSTTSRLTGACEQSLAKAAVPSDPDTAEVLPAGFEYIASCVNSPPYVHIAKGSLKTPQKSLFLRYSSSTSKNNMLVYNLLPITNFSTASYIAINGFYWIGDSGRSSGDTGMPGGHLANNGVTLSDNRVGGGYSKDVEGQSSGNKLVFRWNDSGDYRWEENATAKPLDLSRFNYHISSSTSIVKNGVCSGDTKQSRWSAVGTTEDSKVVFMSSTSDSTTSAAELCRVFKAMNVTNALRLDGGPSTAFVVDSTFHNPLTGMEWVYYGGDARRIAYALIMR